MIDTNTQLISCLKSGDIFLPSEVSDLTDYFCGCGEPGLAWQWVYDYLSSCLEGISFSNISFPPNSGADYIAAYLLAHLGYTEHGTSIGHSWLTEKGMVLLGFLHRWGTSWDEGNMWISLDGTSYGQI